MTRRTPSRGAPPSRAMPAAEAWRRAVAAHRQIDDAVGEAERAAWAPSPPSPPPPALPPAPLAEPIHEAFAEYLLEPIAEAIPEPIPESIAEIIFEPAAEFMPEDAGEPAAPEPAAPEPIVKALPESPPEPAPSPPPPRAFRHEKVALIELREEVVDALAQSRRRAAYAAPTRTYVWDGEARPLFRVDEEGRLTPNALSDEELRDSIQPHWRAIHDACAAAETAWAEAFEHYRRSGLVGHLGPARRRQKMAETAAEETRAARDAIDTLWRGEAMTRRFAQERALADRLLAEAMADVPEAAIATLEAELGAIDALIDAGIGEIELPPGMSRANALALALAEAQPDRLASPQPERLTSPQPERLTSPKGGTEPQDRPE